MGTAFLIVFFGQIIIISVIVVVLHLILDRQLTESAIHRLETMMTHEIMPGIVEVGVVSYKELSPANKNRIQSTLDRKTERKIIVKYKTDKALKGGLVIDLGGQRIDDSLLSRLKESGLVKSEN